MKLGLCVYIGRFSLFHNGHAEVLRRALNTYVKVLVIVGSARQPRTPKNPWKAEERAQLIRAWYAEEQNRSSKPLGELIILTNRDFPYNNQLWLVEVQKLIAGVSTGLPVYITGSKRDDTTFYLDMFPAPTYQLDLVEENRNVSKSLSATWCRELYLGRTLNGKELSSTEYDALIKAFVPAATVDFLDEFEKTEHFEYLQEAHRVLTQRRSEIIGKYGPMISVTIDNVVIQSGHVLLIRRRSHPGKGLWALPGGYLNSNEWTLQGALRELDEESKIDCPPAVLRNSVVFDAWFEHPDRSLISRVITHAFCFKLPDYKVNGRVTLPKVKGSDDADRARWFPLSEALAMSETLFDDHHSILEDFITRLSSTEKSA